MAFTTDALPAGRERSADGATPGDYVRLLKPRVMSLVVFTALVGLLIAPGRIPAFEACLAVLAISLGAGAAGAINMWYDADIDRIMARTAKRPIPSGRVAAEDALALGISLTLLSVVLMGLAANWVAAGLLLFANAFYVFIYTMWLKRRTAQNIVIGGAAGAFPPVIGWAAVTGDALAWEAWLPFLIIFLWTPPHFWALALWRAQDYARAGVPMLPVVAGAAATKRQMLAYALTLPPVALAPWLAGMAGDLYAASAALLSAVFVSLTLAVLRETDPAQPMAKRLFGFSILWLALIFTGLMLDAQPLVPA